MHVGGAFTFLGLHVEGVDVAGDKGIEVALMSLGESGLDAATVIPQVETAPAPPTAVEPEPAIAEPIEKIPELVDAEPVLPIVSEVPKPIDRTPSETKPIVREEVETAAVSQRPQPRQTASGNFDTGNQPGTLSGGQQGNLVTYYRSVEAHLGKFHIYPNSARQRRQEGRVSVSFTINIDGKLTDARIVDGSEHGTLNRAALQTVKRASPVPKIPPTLSSEPLPAVVLMDWHLSGD